MAVRKPGFFEELKRRHVWRVTVAYAVTGWLLIQVVTQVFPFFGIPNWGVRLAIVLIVLGFPVAVLCAWIYELTPDGIRRTVPADQPAARPEAEHRLVSRRLNAVIIALLVLSVALLGWRVIALQPASGDRAVAQRAPAAAAAPVAPAADSQRMDTLPAEIPTKSVAVLPFIDESASRGEQFFSEGLSEDLITALSQLPDLKVISRHSAFQFRDVHASSADIGAKLRVAHLLEGSVQRAGDEVRVTAALVSAADGTIVWSQRYDRPYKDLFALQDDITRAVAAALKVRLLQAPGAVLQSDRPPSGSLAAYSAYQHGVAYYAINTEASTYKAIDAFRDAVRLDPAYAAAYALLARTRNGLAAQFLDGAAAEQVNRDARAAVTAALKLDPQSSIAHQAKAQLLVNVDMNWTGAESEARRALQLAPTDPAAQFYLGDVLASLGRVREAANLTRQALASDPRHASWYNWLATYLTGLGRLDEARGAIGTAIALQPGSVGNHEQLTIIEILRGDQDAAAAAAHLEPDGVWRSVADALVLARGPDRAAADAALAALVHHYARSAPYQIAEVHALRNEPGPMFKWLDRAWTLRDPGIAYLLSDPFILRYRDDPRFAAFCKKVGLPTTTDAVAMK